MKPVHLNGFLKIDDGSIVRVYDSSTLGRGSPLLIWEGKPIDGRVKFFIPKKYYCGKVQVIVAGGESKYYSVSLAVSSLGVFHSVSLKHDHVSLPNSNRVLRSNKYQVEAEAEMLSFYRNAKYKNYLITAVFSAATIASVFVGLYIDGLLGLATGAFLTITSLILGNYASGFSRGV